MVQGVVHDGQKGQPRLLSCGDDLRGRQQEASEPGVSQLKGERILDLRLFVGPVDRAPTGLIWDRNKDKRRVSGLISITDIYVDWVSTKVQAFCGTK